MAVVSPMSVKPPEINPIRYPDIEITGTMASRSEIVEESSPVRVVEDKIYVAVGKDLKESKLTLSWALHKSGGRKLCILYVLEPAQRIPLMGTKFLPSQLEEHQVRAYRDTERQDMNKLLCDYRMICDRAGVCVDVLHIEMDSIEKGIVELISQHSIRKLIMGAAADKYYSKKMMEPRSKKAIYVRLQAPMFCHIWFLCKGNLVHTRKGRLEGGSTEVASVTLRASPNTGSGQSSYLRSQSVTEGQKNQLKLISAGPDHRRGWSDIHGMNVSTFSPDSSRGITPRSISNAEVSFGDWDEISRRSPSLTSRFSSCSSRDMDDYSALTSAARAEAQLESQALHHSKEDHPYSSPPSVLQEGGMNDELYDQLEQAMAEAENSRREAFEESTRRRKAEKDAIDAVRRARTSETLYVEESRQRKEIEEDLARGKEELEKMKQQVDEVMEELRLALEQKSSLESQIASTNQMVQELEDKMFSAVNLLQKYKKERDELQVERDNALKVAEELRKKQAEEASQSVMPQFFSEFSFSEIEAATTSFDPSLKIGEGGYGSIYRGLLRHTQVAIKMLHSHSLQGPSEFQQEVNILSTLRHPNLVTLVGACPEAWILVYEYLPNGSLEDRLSCRGNTPPLSWQTRIRIAAELCSALVFLHSCNHHSVVHGDLKPANILLDANFVSKLSDFGISRVITQNELSSNNTTLCCRTEPKGTFAYMDPEFLSTGELTPMSDVYSFGIILLRLLTGRPALGITKEVQYALDKGNLKDLLDPTAGDWPFVQAKQLAHLAIRCCEMSRKSRPDLGSEVLRVLEPMRVSCGASSFRMSSEEHCQIPSYFICPIFQETMQDPHIAADGFTYELEALKGWIESGHDTSPMTNLKLPHCNLVPNRALRSAIQEWLQQ
ncbi:U-box domain-containing protein 33-like isoform X1 [Actinidia eriantha]|uniref:U-box domain-containing protein 33-like isoform X1 n=1 Tax=Actinidia eriantha TaxID=165200 RepID=UPI0025832F6F|nr:U-box domain-containing protein 33-like isoform X1 [Actinidia eriantha]